LGRFLEATRTSGQIKSDGGAELGFLSNEAYREGRFRRKVRQMAPQVTFDIVGASRMAIFWDPKCYLGWTSRELLPEPKGHPVASRPWAVPDTHLGAPPPWHAITSGPRRCSFHVQRLLGIQPHLKSLTTHGKKMPAPCTTSTPRTGGGDSGFPHRTPESPGLQASFKLELELTLPLWLWKRGDKGGASLQKQARVYALCGVLQ
jgi:hypothetical protein